MSTTRTLSARLGHLAARVLRDDRGQDLIEYALLAAIIAIAGVLALSIFAGKMQNAYINWNTAAQDAWEPCPPGGCP